MAFEDHLSFGASQGMKPFPTSTSRGRNVKLMNFRFEALQSEPNLWKLLNAANLDWRPTASL